MYLIIQEYTSSTKKTTRVNNKQIIQTYGRLCNTVCRNIIQEIRQKQTTKNLNITTSNRRFLSLITVKQEGFV